MWLDETVSPSTSTSGTTRVSNSERERSSSASPLAPLPKRKFSPTDTCARAEPLDQHLLDELARRVCAAKLAVERDHHQLLHARARRSGRA